METSNWKRKHKKKKKSEMPEELLGVISYWDYLLAKAYGGQPWIQTTISQASSRKSSRHGSWFNAIKKLKSKAKLGALSSVVSGFERPNSKGSSKWRFDLGLGRLDKSWKGAWTNINEEESEYSEAFKD